MIELLRAHVSSIALLVALSGLVLMSLTASQPLQAQQRREIDSGSGALAVDIGGAVDGPLRPGVTRYIDLTVRNPSNQDVVITSVAVSLVRVTTVGEPPARPCPPTDFALSAGTLGPLALGAGDVLELSGSAIPRTSWPLIEMLNTSVNQDGCKGAVLTLGYHASGEVR